MTRRPTARRVLRRLLATLPLAVLLLFGPAGPAEAHAYLTSSYPADGGTLGRAPTGLQLHFSESVDLPATHVELVDEAGRHLPVGHLRLRRGDDTEEPSTLTAALPPLGRGVYRVSWETLSSDDLHRTSGVFGFGVGRAATRTAFTEPLPRAEEALLRWAVFAALALACGGLALARLVPVTGGAVRRRCTAWAVAGALAAPVLATALLADQLRSSGSSLGHLLGEPYGQRWLLREAGLLALLAGALLGRRSAGRIAAALGGLGAGTAAIATALLGHAAALPGANATRVLADAAHLTATATWAGGVGVAALVAVRDPAALRPTLRRFGRPALGCVLVAVVTGVYLSSGVVGSVDAALYTWYGRALIGKVLLLAGALAVASVNHRRVRRRGSPVGRGLATEGLLLALALGAAAFLTSGQPAREPEFVTQDGPTPTAFLDSRVADLQERIQLGPNRPGRSVAVIDVYDTRRPAPAPVQRVLVRVLDRAGAGPAAVNAQPLALRGRWSAVVTVPASGRIELEVTVERPGLLPVRHAFGWIAGGRPNVTRAARVSTQPLGGTLRGLAGVMAAGAALMLAGAGLRRRRTGRPGGTPVGTGARVDDAERELERAAR